MTKWIRYGCEPCLGDRVRLCKKCGIEHTLKKWEMENNL
jgi:hypothetical protein